LDYKMQIDLPEVGFGQPKYVRLKQYLLNELEEGRLNSGDVLPTEVEFANSLGVARGTVRHAFDELAREGILQRIRGKGTFIQHPLESQQSSIGSTNDIRGAFGNDSNNNRIALDALVVPETRGGFYPDLLYGFDEAASGHFKQTLIANTDNDLNRQGQTFLQLLEKRVSGVAIVPATQPTPTFQVQALQNQGIPVVFCHRKIAGVSAPLLAIPFKRIGQLSAKAVLGCGHRRIAVVMSVASAATSPLLDGFQARLAEGGVELRPSDIEIGQGSQLGMAYHESRTSKFIYRQFASDKPPTAILVSTDPLAEIIYLQLTRMGLRIPEDVSIISFGAKERRGPIVHRLTSVVLDGVDEGHRAVELLEEMADGRRSIFDTETIQLPLELYKGSTLGIAPN
jgi:GntR family transcriptional regulator, arabinose operon transcriptional repressor